MSWYYKPYVSVAKRRAAALKQLAQMKKAGRAIEPLGELAHRTKIATSFWGRAWCEHLESLGDYENRLPRGRTYVRNGSVLHLTIEKGKIIALVQGSELYEQTIHIAPLPAAKWQRLKKRCSGGIGSIVELLQGKVSDEVMGTVTDPADGLFPTLKEIKLDCSCPDWASLCKHLAAIFYGVGARLDQQPELLFLLRGVDHRELIDESAVATVLAGSGASSRRRTLDPTALNDVFGIELDATPAPVKRGVEETETSATSRSCSLFVPTGKSISELRSAIGLTRGEFAEWIGVSAQSLALWEKQPGLLKIRAKSLENLEALHRGHLSGDEPDDEES